MGADIILLVLFLVVGGVAGYFVRMAVSLSKKKSLEIEVKKLTLDAQEQAQNIVKEAEAKASQVQSELREEEKRKKSGDDSPPPRSLGARSAQQPEESHLATFGMVAISLVFGSETRGLPLAVRHLVEPDNRLTIPMQPGNRSLNLSNSVAVAVYEAWRQRAFQDWQ